MRRDDIIFGTNQVIDAIHDSGIVKALKGNSSAGQSTSEAEYMRAVLLAFNNFSLKYALFTEASKKILGIFGLGKLADPEYWALFFSKSDSRTGSNASTVSLYRQISFMVSEVPKIIALLEQHSPDVNDRIESKSEHSASSLEELGILKIILIEEDGQFSTAKRLISAIESIEEIYDALAKLNNHLSIPLGVGSIDSGSDKSFDLFGAAALMKETRELLLSLWDRVVFFREQKQFKNLELITASLPILEKIKLLETEEKIGREEAQIIRNSIMGGAQKFIESGTIINEMENYKSIDPRQLMAPEKKLLTNRVEDSTHDNQDYRKTDVSEEQIQTEQTEQTESNTSGYSEADLERIAEIMLKKQNENGKT